MQERKSRFLQTYQTKTGFVEYYPQSNIVENNSMWEFRIPIFPTRENLNNVTNLLTPLFAEANLYFKFLALNEPNMNDVTQVSWDGTAPNGKGDRDQRGKECCVYIRFDKKSGRYEKSPEEIKALMLTALKILADNNIEIGYVATPPGDKPIETQDGLPAIFSYAANRPWRGRTGILLPTVYKSEAFNLLARDEATVTRYGDLSDLPVLPPEIRHPEDLPKHNPLLFPDPFAGIHITFDDLEEYEIEIFPLLKSAYKRKEYLKRHHAVTTTQIEIEVQEIDGSKHHDTIPTLLARLKSELNSSSDKIQFILNNEVRFQQVFDLIPKEFSTTYDFHDIAFVAELKYHIGQLKDNKTLDKDQHVVGIEKLLKAAPTEEIWNKQVEIEKNYQRHAFNYIDPSILQSLINKQPQKMQLLFPRIVNHCYEYQALVEEQEKPHIEAETYYEVFERMHLAINTLDRNNPSENKLRKELNALVLELYKSCNDKAANQPGTSPADLEQRYDDAKNIANHVDALVKGVKSEDKEAAFQSVKTFENNVRMLPTYKKATNKNIARTIGKVIIAAVGAVVGMVIGAAVEGAVLALASGHLAGAFGIFGVLHGAYHGSITGWTLGLMAAGAIGLGGGGLVGLEALKGTDRYTRIAKRLDNIGETARDCAKPAR